MAVLGPHRHLREDATPGNLVAVPISSQRVRTTLVVFTASDGDLSKMDLALGPCVTVSGQRRPIVSELAQDTGETPEQAAALLTVLTGEPSDGALRLISASGPAQLFACTDQFLDAMADASEQMLATKTDDDFVAEQDRLSDAWMGSADWPSHYVSLRNRLHRLGMARAARAKGLTLYFWFGPAVQMREAVAGPGPYPRGT